MGRATSFSCSALGVVLALAASGVAFGKAPLRHVVSLDDGWRFLRADAPGAEAPAFDDRRWAHVTLPHTWNAKDGQDGGASD